VSIVLAGAPGGSRGEQASRSLVGTVGSACAELGARVHELLLDSDRLADVAGENELGEEVERLLADASGELDVLVIDGAGLFAHGLVADGSDEGTGSARAALRACLDASWSATHALVNHAFLPGGRGGRIIYLAPGAAAGDHAGAALSGLENLARTLSIEWSRHKITTVAVAPPLGSVEEVGGEVAALTAYLASPAGAYFSGCLLDLRGVVAQLV
jgi:NAD(P)-dependent dehydrogenase (short-subunit alcohol dehydrogenase family)